MPGIESIPPDHLERQDLFEFTPESGCFAFPCGQCDHRYEDFRKPEMICRSCRWYAI